MYQYVTDFGQTQSRQAAEGQALAPNAWFRQADPVAAAIRAFQSALGLPVTGIWDQATHEAVFQWLSTVNSSIDADTPWGSGLGPIIAQAGRVNLLDETFFARVRPVLLALGLPAESFMSLATWFAADPAAAQQMQTAFEQLESHVDMVEKNAPPSAGMSRNTKIAIGIALAVVAAILIYLAMRSRKPALPEGRRMKELER